MEQIRLLFSLFYFIFFSLFAYYIIYFKLNDIIKKFKSVKGELIVCGKNSVQIKLKKQPKFVKAYFLNTDSTNSNDVPCDPGTNDLLKWSAKSYDTHLVLNIEWEVTSYKVIVWEAYY